MERLDLVNISKIYSDYACYAGSETEHNQGIGATNREILAEWHYCAECGTTYMVKHRRRPAFMYCYGYGDNDVSCPNCHKRSVYAEDKKQLAFCLNKKDYPQAYHRDHKKPYAPFNAKLELFDMKNEVRLKSTFKTIEMYLTEDRSDVIVNFAYKTETVDFDVKNRKTTFRIDNEEPIEIGRPQDWIELKNQSMLLSLATDVLESQEEDYRAEHVAELGKKMRQAIQAKWKKIYGYPLKRVNTQTKVSSAGGLLLRQVQNLAFRMVFPDLSNIKTNGDGLSTAFGILSDVFENLDAARKCNNNILHIIETKGLPNKPSIRRIVAKDIFAALELKKALAVTNNFDCNMAIFEKLNSADVDNARLPDDERERMYRFLHMLSEKYKPNIIRNFVVNTKKFSDLEDLRGLGLWAGMEYFTRPLGKMHNYLLKIQAEINKHREEKRRREAARREEERKRQMAERAEHLGEFRENAYNAFTLDEGKVVSLDIPEAVKKKLMTQMVEGKGQFFLPETNEDLRLTSDLMSNCVRTYTERVMTQRCNIVYYASDDGKLVACVEVRGKTIVQAKLSYNRPVWNDSVVNENILEWARIKGLKIATQDIYTGEGEAEAAEEELAGA